MKLLTITVPCYNSEKTLRRCVDSLLAGGEDIEIILVDDGSEDYTAQIADDYARQYPSVVRAIHQTDGGHGEGINTGLLHATGLYFKIVDPDDWVDEAGYQEVLHTLQSLAAGGCMLDMMLCNYVYESAGKRKQKYIRYNKILPSNQLLAWNEMRNLKNGKPLGPQAVLYRTQLLRDCHLLLPGQNRYASHLFVYIPLPCIQMMYYLDVDFYHDSVKKTALPADRQDMLSLIDQHIDINKKMADAFVQWQTCCRPLRHYMLNYLEVFTAASTMMLLRMKGSECQEKKKELWDYIKRTDNRLYHRLRQRIMGQTLPIPAVMVRSFSPGKEKTARGIQIH